MSLYSPEVQVVNTPDVAVPGGVNVNNFPAIQPVSGTVAATQGTSPWIVNSPVSTSSTVTQITSVVGNQTLLAANANRKRAILYFTSGTWNVKLGATASSTSFTYLINSANTTLEIPAQWTGQIDAFNTQANKLVNVTELV